MNIGIQIPKNNNLVIDPGVHVLFENGSMIINGLLKAVGTENDSIIFSRSNKSASWEGLQFDEADSLSILEYCKIEYSKLEGITLKDNSNITISHSRIANNRGEHDPFGIRGAGGIRCEDSSPLITHNSIVNNKTIEDGGGIAIYGMSSPTVKFNIFEKN